MTAASKPVPPPTPAAAERTTAEAVAAQQSDNIAHALAGAGGGILSMALTYPLITLSTRAQVESKRAHTSTLAAVKHILAREGVPGLYAGLDSALFGISVTNFVYYYWYEWTRALFEARQRARGGKGRLGAWESMAAGAIAGSATVLITNPIWVVNTRMTARKNESNAEGDEEKGKAVASGKPSTLSTLRALLRDEGPRALFAGVLPALVLVINPILQYTIFEQLKVVLERRRRAQGVAGGVGARDAFVLGALGKLVATAVTYPYLTVKSRAHVKVERKDGSGVEARDGMVGSLKRIVNEEGWAGLYGGIGPKVTQSVLTAAFLFAFKDALYDAMVQMRKKAKA